MNANAKAWVAALRSGKYQQGVSYLRTSTAVSDKFCCLGVACDLAVKAGVIPPPVIPPPVKAATFSPFAVWVCCSYGCSLTRLPEPVVAWLDLSSRQGEYGTEHAKSSLDIQNDVYKKSFKDIASIIESEPAGLFDVSGEQPKEGI